MALKTVGELFIVVDSTGRARSKSLNWACFTCFDGENGRLARTFGIRGPDGRPHCWEARRRESL